MSTHAHWIIYGWSSKCSNCGFSRIGNTKVCQQCGAVMDGDVEHDIPKLSLKEIELPVRIICTECGNDMYELKSTVRYCYNCGAQLSTD